MMALHRIARCVMAWVASRDRLELARLRIAEEFEFEKDRYKVYGFSHAATSSSNIVLLRKSLVAFIHRYLHIHQRLPVISRSHAAKSALFRGAKKPLVGMPRCCMASTGSPGHIMRTGWMDISLLDI